MIIKNNLENFGNILIKLLSLLKTMLYHVYFFYTEYEYDM